LIARRCGSGFGVRMASFFGLRFFGLRFFGLNLFGLEALQFVESVAVIAVGAIDAALEAGEFAAVNDEGLAEDDGGNGGKRVFGAVLPEVGLDGAETAEEPFGVNERVDEHARFGGGGVEAAVIFGLEGFEVGK